MTERSAKPGSSRKRALVSCDRCKIRRARCIRDNADVPCADCKASGVACESKLPRKQRVYGSVETLSLRYRALEALVKGLFPNENVQDTETLFRIAAARNITMPASDDFTPADIFSNSGSGSGSGSDQRASSSQQQLQLQQQQQQQSQQQSQQPPPQQYPQRQALPQPFQGSSFPQQVLPGLHTTVHEAAHSSGGSSPQHKSKQHRRNTLSESHRPPSQAEDLLRTSRRTSHYFGPSSSFRLAKTIRTLAARWIAITGASAHSFISDPSSTSGSILKRSSTDPSNEDLTMHETTQILLSGTRSRKRSRSQLEESGDELHPREDSRDAETIAKFLPPRNVADTLVATYFDRVHMYMPLFNRSVFEIRLDATYSRTTEVISECKDSGWLVVLALVFSFGCQRLEEPESKQARELRVKYLEFSRTYFRQLLTTACLDNVQALVLLNIHHHSVGQKSSSWLLIGLAARMATTMGMHRDDSNLDFELVERNTRRQVWWTIYIFEKTLCSILGRPTAIDDREMSMQIPEAPAVEQPSLSASSMSLCFDLVRLSYSIRQRAYFDQTSAEERSPTPAVAKALLRELDSFFASIPPNMSLDCYPLTSEHKSMVLLLHIYYYYTRCIVTRDFLIQKIENHLAFLEDAVTQNSDDWRTTLVLAEDCVESVHKSLQCITAGIELGIIGYSWLDFFYVFHSVLIVCADFLARPKEQPESTRDAERKTTVQAVLNQVRDMQTLAPTYRTLSRIALQFANITEVANDTKSPTPTDTPHDPSLEPVAPAASDPGVEHVMQLADLGEDWFTNATADLGLDFFDLGHVTNPVPFPMADPASCSEPTAETTSEGMDDWTAKTLKGMHNI